MDQRIEKMIADGTYVVENHPSSADSRVPVDPVPGEDPSLYRGTCVAELDMLGVHMPIPGSAAKWLLVVCQDSVNFSHPVYVVTPGGELMQAVYDVHGVFALHDVLQPSVDNVANLLRRARDYV